MLLSEDEICFAKETYLLEESEHFEACIPELSNAREIACGLGNDGIPASLVVILAVGPRDL